MDFCFRSFRIFVILVTMGIASGLWAQNSGGSVHGTVTDPSGAAVTGATVIAVTPDGQAKTATTNKTGGYEINGLAPGKYTVTVSATTVNGIRKNWTARAGAAANGLRVAGSRSSSLSM